MPDVASVIVPTYRRPREIIRCVQSLCRQTSAEFEVIVVDNGCDDRLASELGTLDAAEPVPIRYLAEPNLGVHNARHAGARAASGKLLLFVDDDVVCDPGWVAAYVEAFRMRREIVAAGGPIEPEWQAPPPAWLRQLATRSSTFEALALMEPYDEFTIAEKGFFFSANMAIRREMLFELGGFNPEAFGDAWLGDGETGLNLKLWESGAAVAYVPEARVRHFIPPDRMTLEYLRRRMRNQGAADVYTRLHKAPIDRRLLSRLLAQNVRRSVVLWSRSLVQWRRLGAVDLHLAAARCSGEASYLARLLVHKRLWALVTRERWLDPLPER